MGSLPNRIIKESICTSNEIDALKPEEEVLFYRIIVNCDDYGRMDARLPILRAKCFPLRIDSVKDKDISSWLDSLIEQGLIFTYEADGKMYLQMATWEKHQQVRAKRSKFPAPDDGVVHKIADDINGNQAIANVPVIQSNPIQSESNLESESNPSKSFEETSQEYIFAEKLRGLILKNNPKARTPDDLQKWAFDFDKILRLDNRSPTDVDIVIEYSQASDFWMTNVLSPGKLREKFDTLYLQAKKQGGATSETDKRHPPGGDPAGKYPKYVKS